MAALIPLVLSIAPELAQWLFGPKAAATTGAVAQAVQAVTGTPDAQAAQAVLSRDPQAAAQLRVQLAQIAAQAQQDARQSDLSELTARLQDTAGARNQTVALAQAHSAVALGAPIVSIVVLLTFGVVMALALTRTIPTGSETILNMLLGTLAAMATSVVSYWVGSSAGSARKDTTISSATTALAGNASSRA